VRQLATCLFVLAVVPTARAQDESAGAAAPPDPLAEARAAYAAEEFDRAAELFANATGLEPAGVATVEIHLGILARARGEREAARAHFDRALAIDPALVAPRELPPRGRAIFEAARRARSGPLALVAEPPSELSERGAITIALRVENAPPAWLSDLRATLVAPDGRVRWWDVLHVDATEVTIPAPVWESIETAELVIEARRDGGNIAARSTLALARPQPLPPIEPLPEPEPEPLEEPAIGLAPAEQDLTPQRADDRTIFEEPAFWAVVGSVVAVGVTAAILGATVRDHYVVGPAVVVPALTFP
jgi:tetratricopeptide (TPR) repeat protein